MIRVAFVRKGFDPGRRVARQDGRLDQGCYFITFAVGSGSRATDRLVHVVAGLAALYEFLGVPQLAGSFPTDAEKTIPGFEVPALGAALSLVEDQLRSRNLTISAVGGDQEAVIEFGVIGLSRVRAAMAAKSCSYQVRDGRELFCTAAHHIEPTIKLGARSAAATSRQWCAACGLPDAAVLCSHLVHPITIKNSGRPTRDLAGAVCDRGETAISVAHQCRAGGNTCWERVEDSPTPSIAEPVSTLAIHEALDYLSAIWKGAFGDSLLGRTNYASLGRLGHPCITVEDFDSRMMALGVAINSIVVHERLLPPAKEGVTKIAGSIARMVGALERQLSLQPPPPPETPDALMDRVKRAADLLRATTKLRNSLVHPTPDLPDALATLGIPYPMPAWPETWDRVRSKAVEAIGIIREVVQGFVA